MTKAKKVQTPNTVELRKSLKPYVKSFYDFQASRTAANNRGLDKKGEAPKSYLTQEDKGMFQTWGNTFEMYEAAALTKIENILSEFGVYNDFLSDVGGIGPTMAGVLLASFDPYRAPHASNYWAYAGLAQGREVVCSKCGGTSIVTGDLGKVRCWKGRSIKAKGCGGALTPTGKMAHQRKIEGEPLRFNAWLRTKMFVIAGCFLKAKNCEYKHFYYDYKHRLTSEGRTFGATKKGKPKEWTDGHYHMAAMRYMIKMFLIDFWKWDRAEEGLEVGESYQEAKLGHHHGETT